MLTKTLLTSLLLQTIFIWLYFKINYPHEKITRFIVAKPFKSCEKEASDSNIYFNKNKESFQSLFTEYPIISPENDHHFTWISEYKKHLVKVEAKNAATQTSASSVATPSALPPTPQIPSMETIEAAKTNPNIVLEEAFVSFVRDADPPQGVDLSKYVNLLEVVIASVHAFSNRPIIVYHNSPSPLPFNTTKYNRLISRRMFNMDIIYNNKFQSLVLAPCNYGKFVMVLFSLFF